MITDTARITWPAKRSLLGVQVSATTYDQTIDAVVRAARARVPACVSALAVHGLVTGMEDHELRAKLNQFEILTPDGEPVRLALNLLHQTRLPERVYGPELTRRLSERAAHDGIPVYFYGSQPHVVEALAASLTRQFPGLQVAGREPSLFRPLTPAEDAALVARVNGSGAGIIFVGLGCPVQERFAYDHRGRVLPVQVCVGAAFDFLSGTKPMAPAWMQRYALEWLFRLCHEPARLWRRYAYTNTRFLLELFLQASGFKTFS